MESDQRQDRRDERRHKDRHRMVVHKVKSPRSGERLIKIATRRAFEKRTAKHAGTAPPRRGA